MGSLLLSFLFILFLVLFHRIYSSPLLPFGTENGDQSLKCHDGSSSAGIPLPDRFLFLERQQSAYFISCNGAVSFGMSLFDLMEDLDLVKSDVIAVFYAPSKHSTIYYRTMPEDASISMKLSNKIRSAFSDSSKDFVAKNVVLITWDGVENFEQTAKNRYQLALAASHSETFAIFIYNKLDWVESDGRFAQVGFFGSDGQKEKVLNSGNASIGELLRITNFDETGVFLFKISDSYPVDPKPLSSEGEDYDYRQEQQDYGDGRIGICPPQPDNCPQSCNIVLDERQCQHCICSNIVSPEKGNYDHDHDPSYSKLSHHEYGLKNFKEEGDGEAVPNAAKPIVYPPTAIRRPDLTCSSKSEVPECGANSECVSLTRGHCCECKSGFFGNGAECLSEKGPVRLNGVFEGVLNGRSLEKTETFAYVHASEGQQHFAIAISKIPINVGLSMLLLEPLASVMGWLFAKTMDQRNQPNGFQLTGGNFTRTVSIHLGDRYMINIKQSFMNREFNDVFSMNTFISGTVPEFAHSPVPEIQIPMYEEVFRREKPGIIRAYSEHQLSVTADGNTEPKPFRITIDQKIEYTECPHKDLQFESVTVFFERVSAQYSEKENVVRYSLQSSLKESAVPHLTETQTQQDEELQQYNDKRADEQQDQDPCAAEKHFCTEPFMVCIPTASTYRCECQSGYSLVQNSSSQEQIQCVPINKPQPRQQKSPNSAGECTQHNQCHIYGECFFDPNNPSVGQCRCRGWYVGDGVQHCGPPEQQVEQARPVAEPTLASPSQQYQPIVPPGNTICRSNNECGENAECKFDPRTGGYYTCQCLPGFSGDGIECTSSTGSEQSVEEPGEPAHAKTAPSTAGRRKPCSDQNDCHTSGHCVLDDSKNEYFCQCLPGYQGDGKEECDRAECDPTNGNSCKTGQQCLLDSELNSYLCKCPEGFEQIESGGECVPASSPGANLASGTSAQGCNCGPNAKCIQQAFGYNCICNPGFTGNGFDCRPEEENCAENREMCSPFAQCLPDNTRRTYVCMCNYGYRGNGLICQQEAEQQVSFSAPATNQPLLVGRGMAIVQRTADPTNLGKQLLILPHQIVVSIDYDCHTGRIFWSDIAGHKINSATLNGTNVETYYADVLKSPEGIAIDWSSRNIYYADSIKNEIGVLSMDGRFQKALVTSGLRNPRSLAIDLDNRYLYYSDWSRESPKIGRMRLDGSQNEVFVSEDIFLPNGIVVLPNKRLLCWVDAGTQRLSCIGLDGTGRRVIYSSLEYPFGLTCENEERFYWTDWKNHKIHSVSIFGTDYKEFSPGAGGKGKVYGILSVPGKCHGGPTPCAKNNGGCSHLCLPGGSNESICKCPDNLKDCS